MLGKFRSHHRTAANGKPAGGTTWGTGFAIAWQTGPLGICTCAALAEGNIELSNAVKQGTYHFPSCERIEPNGAFVETILDVVRDRLQYYQGTEFACDENAKAINRIDDAMWHLEKRTRERVARGVEGTHEV